MIQVGLQNWAEKVPAGLQGARVALLAHPASVVTIHDKHHHAVDLIYNHPDLDLVRLFGPEHGLYGAAQAGETVSDGVNAKTGLPVISLYGERRAPEPEHLQDVDALLFDLQDVGVRCFTYLSTLKACLKVCAETATQLVILERPNPLGRGVFGPGVEVGFESFVSAHDVPFVHGKTLAELGKLIARGLGLESHLQVIATTGWEGEPWDETDLPWIPPSPNLPRFESALCYPVTVFLEGTNVSEGRGSGHPFEQIGAPWLDSATLVEALKEVPGVRARTVTFVPSSSKYAGQEVRGVRLKVVDRNVYDPVAGARVLLGACYRQAPEGFQWLKTRGGRFFVDLLYGSSGLRQAVSA